MNQKVIDRNLLICCLQPEELEAWGNGGLDKQARLLGIKGWIAPIKVDKNGNIIESIWNNKIDLPAAPWIDLRHAMSPAQEIKLSYQLKKWWQGKETLKIMGKQFFVLSGTQNLSHKIFSTKRFKLHFQDTLMLGMEEEWMHKLNNCMDFIIQTNLKGSKKQPTNYLENHKRAHHDLDPNGILIPSVKGVAYKERSLWRNASAINYRQWLLQASAWSRIRFLGHPEAPVLIDNWKGHLSCWEPEIKSGTAQSKSVQISENYSKIYEWGDRKRENIAIMVHAFYVDKLKEILDCLPSDENQSGIPKFDLYLSTPFDQIDTVEELLKKQGRPRVYLCGVKNQGRDIAPFLLNLLPAALEVDHSAFIKLHTKQSPHLNDGHSWSDHLVNSLLDPKLLSTFKEELQNNSRLGLIAPSGTLVKTSVALSRNVDHLEMLLGKVGWEGTWALSQTYIAGSMMGGRLSAMKSFKRLDLTIDQFEAEHGQTDGTFAHALERLISLQYLSQNFFIKVLPGKSESVPQFGYGWV